MAKKTTEKTDDLFHSMPSDVREVINSNDSLKLAWDDLSPIARNEWICWITSGKKAETRVKRLQRAQEELAEGKKRPCCWPGCPHRRPSAAKWFKSKAG